MSGQNNSDFFTAKYHGANGSLIWDVTDSTFSSGESYGIAVDSNGNVFSGGRKFNGTTSNFYLAKYNSTGSHIENLTNDAGAYIYGVAVDSDDNVIVSGYSDLSDDEIYTVKYSNDLSVLWSRSYAGTTGTDQARDVAVDLVGNIYVAGYSIGATTEIALLKYSSTELLLLTGLEL